MRTVSGAAAVMLCWVFTVFPAQADWQYTKWNMTRAQVIAAAQGAAQAVKGTRDDQVRGYDLGAAGSYSSDDFQFKSEFFFNKAGRLSLVRLLPRQASCQALERSLRAVYGKPAKKSDVVDVTVTIWRDSAKQNLVQLSTGADPGDCLLIYEPLKRSGRRGL